MELYKVTLCLGVMIGISQETFDGEGRVSLIFMYCSYTCLGAENLIPYEVASMECDGG